AALPFVHATVNGVTPYRFASVALAPARSSSSTASRSSLRTAQCSAVVPSAAGAFTSTFSRSIARSAVRSPSLTAPESVWVRAAADDDEREIDVGVLIGVAQASALHDHRVIEQRSVAVGGRAQLRREPGQEIDVVAVDLGRLLELHRVVLVVRDRVMRLRDA